MKAILSALLLTQVWTHSAHMDSGIDSHTLLHKLNDVHADQSQLPAYAVCRMQSHASVYNVSGYVRFAQTMAIGTEISGRIEGLDPGSHAFHIHELGDLTNTANGCISLAAHYNPFGDTHGGPEACHRHIGDLGNLMADENGVAVFNFTDSKIAVVGPYSILGRSCVVHLKEDDLGLGGTEESLKTGSAGDRVSCGVVGRAGPPTQ